MHPASSKDSQAGRYPVAPRGPIGAAPPSHLRWLGEGSTLSASPTRRNGRRYRNCAQTFKVRCIKTGHPQAAMVNRENKVRAALPTSSTFPKPPTHSHTLLVRFKHEAVRKAQCRLHRNVKGPSWPEEISREFDAQNARIPRYAAPASGNNPSTHPACAARTALTCAVRPPALPPAR